MRFALLVALSHLRSRRREQGISVITFVSMLGVMVGVTALIMVLAVMEGFELDLRDKILGSNAHIVIFNFNGSFSNHEEILSQIRSTEGISAAAPFVYSEMMIRSSHSAAGVVLKGISPEETAGVTDVAKNVTTGPKGPLQTYEEKQEVVTKLHNPDSSVFQSNADTEKLPGIIIGQELASQLWVSVGDKVHIINPIGGGVGLMGMPTPQVKSFRIAGIFYSGMYEYDTKWTYVALEDAQSFLKMGDQINGLEVKVHNIDEAEILSEKLESFLVYPFRVRHWKELNSNLFSALKLEKIVMGLILSLIVMVASLNIVGTLILVVLTRGREIAILRAMGSSSYQIRSIFMLEGLIIGLVGTSIGTCLGLIGCFALDRYKFPLDTDVYYLDTLPVVVEPETVVFVALAAVFICFSATIYPSYIAAKMDPVEGLRYD